VGSLLLVRHAPTDASQEGRNLGQRSDPALSAPGLRLAARLGAILAAEVAALPAGALRLLTSPAQRCRQTAEAIAGSLPAALQAEVVAVLAEIDYGQWEGLTSDECVAQDPELRAAWEADPFATRAPGGESGADVATRAFPTLVEIRGWLTDDPTRCAIVVAHNHVNRLWLTSLLGWPMADYRRRLSQDPAGYSHIAFDGGVPLVRRLNARPMEE
jgi:broad specificity phosphatase PhoE